MNIRHPKDFWAGVMYLAIGLGATLMARRYNMGTAVRMGPGFFPMVLAALLGLVGLASVVRSFCHDGETIVPLAWRPLSLVLGSIVLFGLLIRGLGLGPSVLLTVLIGASASARFRWRAAVPLALATAAFSIAVFVKALGAPFPILGSWFGL